MKNSKIKLMVGALLVSMMGATLTGCGGNEEAGTSSESTGTPVTISISGSTSVGPLIEKVQEVYEAKNSNVTLEIQQTGSGAGIKDAQGGISDIGMVSRELKDTETGLNETVIAHDGIALLVHPNNKVKNITIDQIKDIYTGKLTNWKELGGVDAPIVIVSREDGSGTRGAFQEIIKFESEELTKDASIVDGSGAVKTTVAGNENAIGYASFEYIDSSVAALSVDNVEPKAENVLAGTYKISRPFLLVTKEGTENTDAKALIDFILSDEGQKIVSDNKLISVK